MKKQKDLFDRYPILKQFSRFVLIGFLNFFIDFSILNALMYFSGAKTGWSYVLWKSISFICAVIFSYVMNKRWTFEDSSNQKQVKKFSQFIFVSVIGMLVNVSAAGIIVNYIQPILPSLKLSQQIWGSLGAIAGAGTGLIWNFIGYKYWVFKK